MVNKFFPTDIKNQHISTKVKHDLCLEYKKQTLLIDKINDYLTWYSRHEKEERIIEEKILVYNTSVVKHSATMEKSYDRAKIDGGACYGIGGLWAYCCMIQDTPNTLPKERDDLDWFWKNYDTLLLSNGNFDELEKDEHKEIQRFISFIRHFQNPDFLNFSDDFLNHDGSLKSLHKEGMVEINNLQKEIAWGIKEHMRHNKIFEEYRQKLNELDAFFREEIKTEYFLDDPEVGSFCEARGYHGIVPEFYTLASWIEDSSQILNLAKCEVIDISQKNQYFKELQIIEKEKDFQLYKDFSDLIYDFHNIINKIGDYKKNYHLIIKFDQRLYNIRKEYDKQSLIHKLADKIHALLTHYRQPSLSQKLQDTVHGNQYIKTIYNSDHERLTSAYKSGPELKKLDLDTLKKRLSVLLPHKAIVNVNFNAKDRQFSKPGHAVYAYKKGEELVSYYDPNSSCGAYRAQHSDDLANEI